MSPSLIAVVDDDRLTLKLMQMLLTGKGYETILWSEAETACTMIRQQRPHLVLLDLYMQGDPSAGLKILEQLHEDPTTTTIGLNLEFVPPAAIEAKPRFTMFSAVFFTGSGLLRQPK